MKNSLIVTAILFLGSLIIQAQDVAPAENPNGAGMKFEFEEYDFGNVNEGEDASVDFVFTNDGKEKLILTDVKASCGCTTPFWSKEPVMPGETGKITAKYNTQGRPGNFNKAITITSNAAETQRIYIKGNVVGKDAEMSKKNGVPERTPSIVNDLNVPY